MMLKHHKSTHQTVRSGLATFIVMIVIMNDDVYGAVIAALPLREFTRFI